MSSSAGRLLGVVVTALVVCVLIGVYIGAYLTNAPGATAASTAPAGVNLYIATVPAAEPNDRHPTWVSYYTTDSHGNNWKHNTTFVVPANTLVHVTLFQYDGASGLRNEFLAQVEGTVGGNFLLNGKPTVVINPADASHIFAIPQLGLNVPLEGVPSTAKNPCGNAPCTTKQDHETIQFTFRSGPKGLYRWQCFVPCAAGYIQGFGGPMQTVGYMDGFLKVV